MQTKWLKRDSTAATPTESPWTQRHASTWRSFLLGEDEEVEDDDFFDDEEEDEDDFYDDEDEELGDEEEDDLFDDDDEDLDDADDEV